MLIAKIAVTYQVYPRLLGVNAALVNIESSVEKVLQVIKC